MDHEEFMPPVAILLTINKTARRLWRVLDWSDTFGISRAMNAEERAEALPLLDFYALSCTVFPIHVCESLHQWSTALRADLHDAARRECAALQGIRRQRACVKEVNARHRQRREAIERGLGRRGAAQ